MTVQRESHYDSGDGFSSLEGCRKLAGGNTPGCRAIISVRPGGARENLSLVRVLKVIKGIISKSTLDLGCSRWQMALRPDDQLTQNRSINPRSKWQPAELHGTLLTPGGRGVYPPPSLPPRLLCVSVPLWQKQKPAGPMKTKSRQIVGAFALFLRQKTSQK